MAKVKLTDQQRAAVEDRGGTLLVSAAAGSGKTKVLVERLFRYVTEERRNLDDFLIITYTRAAAAELRSKIAAELNKRLGEDPGDGRLRRQLLRVYQADIKTVDAFCTALLRENTHLLAREEDRHALTPDFRVLDEADADLLRRRAWAGSWRSFMETWMRAARRWRTPWGRPGRQMPGGAGAGVVRKAPEPRLPGEVAGEEPGGLGGPAAGFDGTPYAAELLAQVRRRAAHWAALLRSGADRTAGDEALERGYGEKFSVAAGCSTPWPGRRPGRRPGCQRRRHLSPSDHPQGPQGGP
jgi:ATP-dependent helicase/nuclease subunit A